VCNLPVDIEVVDASQEVVVHTCRLGSAVIDERIARSSVPALVADRSTAGLLRAVVRVVAARQVPVRLAARLQLLDLSERDRRLT
jgi:hypothetical protein